jgi:putative spermidine/putrescine transport system permease protein
MDQKSFSLIYLCMMLLPLLLGLGYALAYSFGLLDLLHPGWTSQHWQEVLGGGEFWRSLFYSIYIATAAVFFAVVLAFALLIAVPKPLERGALSQLIYWPLALPNIVAAFAALQLLSRSGFFSRIAWQLGWIEGQQGFIQLTQDHWGIGVLLTHTFLAMPFFYLLLRNLYQSERIGALIELASSMGASRKQRLGRLLLPILGRKILPSALMYWIFVMGSYEIPLLLGGQRYEMVSVLILRKLKGADLAVIPQAYVIASFYTFLVALLTIVFFLLQRKNHA